MENKTAIKSSQNETQNEMTINKCVELNFITFQEFINKIELYSLNNVVRDCTVKIKGNINGHEVDLEITISDVSWVKCRALQLGVAAMY